MHRHPDARLCFGDALMDHYHKWIWRECPKTYHYRSSLRNPANPADKMKCDYCDTCRFSIFENLSGINVQCAAIAWDIWNQWCYTCDEFTCKNCVETGRAAHRHPLAWTRVLKKSVNTQLNFNDKRNCDRCGTTIFASLFEGMECAICRDYHCCLACLQKSVRPQHPSCKGRQVAFDFWLLRN